MDYGGTHDTHSKLKPGSPEQKHVNFMLVPANQDSSNTPSPSSSSSSSSSSDFFQVDPRLLPKFEAQDEQQPHEAEPNKPFYENDEIDLSNEVYLGPTPRFSDISRDSLSRLPFPPTQSPQVQVMQRPVGYDPNRIPPSIYSKSSTPTEWSLASNDSLFSIHIGEASFSSDYFCRLDLNLTDPGELLMSLKRSDVSIGFGSNSLDSKEIKPYLCIEKSTIDEDVKIEGAQVIDEPKKDGPETLLINEVDEVKREPEVGPYRPNRLPLPEKSQVRVENFVKPIKKKSSSCGMCHCCGCKWLSCSCCCSFKWCFSCFKCPTCSCKFSPCSCCSCSFWSCFKCSSWSCCKCRCLNFTWACCYFRKREQKPSSCDSQVTLSDTTSRLSTKTTSRKKCSCFSFSCCSCWSCSCCC